MNLIIGIIFCVVGFICFDQLGNKHQQADEGFDGVKRNLQQTALAAVLVTIGAALICEYFGWT